MFPGEMHFGNGSFPLVIFEPDLFLILWFHQKSFTSITNCHHRWKRETSLRLLQETDSVGDRLKEPSGSRAAGCVCVLDWILWTLLRVFYWVLNVRVEICRGCCWFRHIHAHILFHADVSNPNTAVSTWSSFVMLMSLLSVQVMLTAWSSECVEAGPVRWTAVWWCSTVMRELNQLVLLSAPRGVHVLQMFCFSWTAAWSDCGEASGMS